MKAKKLLTPLLITTCLWCCKPAVQERADVDSVATTSPDDTLTDEMLGNAKADEYFEYEEAMLNTWEYTMVGSLRKLEDYDHNSIILIAMKLKSDNGIMSGKYFYANSKNRQDISLRGTMEGDSIVLVEYDPNDNITGRFNGRMDDLFEGEWSSPDNKKKYYFKIKGDDHRSYEELKNIGVKIEDLEID